MDEFLKKLFDYQHFAGNEELNKLINETEERVEEELSDDDLSEVAAAGYFNVPEGARVVTGKKNGSHV